MTEFVDDFDLDLDISEIQVEPDFVDMTSGVYVVRVAGLLQRDFMYTNEADEELEDALEVTARNVVYQVVACVDVEEPAPEIGGLFQVGGIIQFKFGLSVYVKAVTFPLKLLHGRVFKGTLRAAQNELIEKFDRENFLLLTVKTTEKGGRVYANVKATKLFAPADVLDWEANMASFPFVNLENYDA